MRYRLDKNFKAHVKLDKWDTWSADSTMAQMIYPLLVAFRLNIGGYPCAFDSIEEWGAVVDKMVNAFEILADRDNLILMRSDDEQRVVDEGLALFAEYFEGLWN